MAVFLTMKPRHLRPSDHVRRLVCTLLFLRTLDLGCSSQLLATVLALLACCRHISIDLSFAKE